MAIEAKDDAQAAAAPRGWFHTSKARRSAGWNNLIKLHVLTVARNQQSKRSCLVAVVVQRAVLVRAAQTKVAGAAAATGTEEFIEVSAAMCS